MSSSPTPPPKPEIKGASRAFVIGASASFVLLVLAIALGWVSVASGIRHIKKYSSKEALSFSFPESKEQYTLTLQKIAAALDKAHKGQETELRLNALELNSLLAHDLSFDQFRQHCRLNKITEDAIFIDISFPIDKLKWASWTDVEGQFLNGQVLLTGRMKKDYLVLVIDQVQHDGKKIMLDTMESLKEHNALTFWPAAEQYQEDLQLIRGMSLEDGEVILKVAPFKEDD
ncbi:hypothetical protein PQO03_09835 [Lentisphaera profundi]|uniref:Uncharacterized protein n=1 Tax=Lentisphaera profundi TaxID=1658616 RepID=A0ABY7VVD0_9BACT|nr:hypothetical protein [Lentisphaera profundi]WDE96013.1 hypothetical protein PQO03_09835 [Lentisphaera profundi]